MPGSFPLGMPPRPAPGGMGLPLGGPPGMPPPLGAMTPPAPSLAGAPQMAPPPAPVVDPLALGWALAGTRDEDMPALLASLPESAIGQLAQMVDADPLLQARFQRIAESLEADEYDDEDDDYPIDPPPKPTWGQVDAWANQEESNWRERRERVRRDIQIWMGRERGIFKLSQEEKYREEYHSTGLTDDTNLAISVLGSAEVIHKITPVQQGAQQDAQECEDTLRYLRREHARRHRLGGNGSMARDEGAHVCLAGAVVSRRTVDLYDRRCPIRVDLIDPTTCYPTFGGPRGMIRMIRVYTCKVSDVIADYDTDGSMLDRLVEYRAENGKGGQTNANRSARDEVGATLTNRQLWESVDVVEYWDTGWRGVWLKDGFEVIPLIEHQYGKVPFVYCFSNLGRPRSLGDPMVDTVILEDGSESVVRGDDFGLVDVGLSFFGHRRDAHFQYEAAMGMLYKLLGRADRPAWFVYQDAVGRAASEERDGFDASPDAENPLAMDHEQLQPWLATPQGAVFEPLLNAMAADKATGQMPLAMYGAAASSQSTGAAHDAQVHAGQDKLAPLFDTLVDYHTQCAEHDLWVLRRFGDALIDDEEGIGGLRIPYAPERRMEEPSFRLTPRTIRRAGCQIEVFMENPSTRNLPLILNAAAIGIQSGQMSRREAIELRGKHNPDAVLDEIIEEQAWSDPAAQKARIALALLRSYTGPSGVPDPMVWLVLDLLLGQSQPPGGMPPGGMMPPPGGPQPSLGPPGGAPNTSGMNLQPFAPGVGAGAGRPPIGAGPPPGLPGLPPMPTQFPPAPR